MFASVFFTFENTHLACADRTGPWNRFFSDIFARSTAKSPILVAQDGCRPSTENTPKGMFSSGNREASADGIAEQRTRIVEFVKKLPAGEKLCLMAIRCASRTSN